MALPKLYEQITWVNDTTPALNEDNLNAMSQALDDIDDRVIGLAGTIMEDVPQIIEDMEILGPAVENIDENVARAEGAADDAEAEALKSEGYAVGKQDGVEVTSGEYYQNNAKYYAEIANPPIENTVDFTDVIAISDAINKAAKDVRLKVEAVQDLHGYTKPWVGGAGKNKLPFDLATIKALNTGGTWSGNSYTVNGVTFTVNNDGTYTVTTSAAPTNMTILSLGDYSANGMILNGCPSGGSDNTYKLQAFYSGAQLNDYGNGVTINDANTRSFRIVVYAGAGVINKTFAPMLSTSGGNFEPYTNICPITGHSEAKVTRAGKNLLEGMESGAIDQSTGQNTSGSATRSINHIGVVPSTSYTISGLLIEGGAIRVFKYDSSMAYLGNEVVNFSNYKATLTIASGVYYIRFQGGETSFTPTTQVQVEAGTIATAYEPYTALDMYIIGLDGTRYGGVLDVTSGVLTLTHEYKDMGDLSWEKPSSYFRASISAMKTGSTDSKCSIYKVVGTYSQMTSEDGTCERDSNGYLYVNDSTHASDNADTYKTAVTGQQLVYELATPQTIQLSPIQVYLLYGYNTLFGDCGDISLTYDASGIIHIEEAKLDTETLKTIAAASSDFADFKARIAAL